MNVAMLNPNDDESTLKRIAKLIATPPETSRVFTIGPVVAEEILRLYNKGNRSPKPVNIHRYSADMAAREWAVTGDTLKFSNLGLLRDGQNRLMACVRSGVPFTTHVVFGVEDSCFDRMDSGKKREGSDMLAIAGVPNTTVIASAIKWAYLIDTGAAKKRDTLDPKEILRLYNERYSGLQTYVRQAERIYRQTGHPKSVVTALLYQFYKANSDAAQKFSDAWESGQWQGKFKAIGLMQQQIAALQSSSMGRVHDTARAALIVKAWNLYVSGRQGRRDEIIWTPADDFPQIKG